MADGIKIYDAALEISPAGLEALVKKQGADITISKLDAALTEEGLNALLRGLMPEGTAARSTLQPGQALIETEGGEQPLRVDLRIAGLSLTLADGEVRLVTG